MATPEHTTQVSWLLEQLVTDPALRAEFRRDPQAVCRAHDLPELADELGQSGGKAFQTLELRESKSSMAGMLMAAAAEGVGFVELVHYVQGNMSGESARAAGAALSRANLPAVHVQGGAPAVDVVAGAAPGSGGAAEAAAAAGPASPSAQTAAATAALLNDPKLRLGDAVRVDLISGAADPRAVSALAQLAVQHRIEVTAISPDGGFDISMVDGRPVSAHNAGARFVADELASMDDRIRPSRLASPWQMSGEGLAGAEQRVDRIHIGYDSPPPDDLTLPDAPPLGASSGGTFQAIADGSGTTPTWTAAGDLHPVLDVPPGFDHYPGPGATKGEIAAWMATEAQKRGLPPELPVMAALVESRLSNVPAGHGDLDSAGFFQMREQVWNHGPYRGYAGNPELQLKWFLDHAEAVRNEKIAAGDANFGSRPRDWGTWAADIERPAYEYRGRYAEHMGQARHILARAGHPAGSAALPELADQIAGTPADTEALRGLAALHVARSFLGTDYVWGGETPQSGFDCSGLMQWSYAQVGVHLPRVAADQFNVGEHIDKADLRPGDLVFFADKDSQGNIIDVHHVGMYVGDGKFIHAPHTGDVVKISSLSDSYYMEEWAGARRVAGLADANAPIPANLLPRHLPAMQGADANVQAPGVVGTGAFPAVAAGAGQTVAHTGSTVQFMPAVAGPPAGGEASAAVDSGVGGGGSGAPGMDWGLPDPQAPYPGDNAPPEEIAKWMGRQAEAAGLPRELPVMASLTESGMRNLSYGDASSVGYFQMLDFWNQGEYKGFKEHPELQLKWFIDHAVAMKQKRIDEGYASYGDDPNTWGNWIADVERPATEYRGRYQTHLAEAKRLLS